MELTVDVAVVVGLVYEPGGQRLDVYQPATTPEAAPVVLLWHGTGPEERDVLTPLARAAASLGVVCFVPDWRPDAHDRGRSHLRASAVFARENAADFGGDTGRVALAGWSLGGKAAMAAALDPRALDGWRPQAVVGVAGGYTGPDPLTGRAPLDELTRAEASLPGLPVRLVHGSADPVVDIRQSRRLHAALQLRGWPSSLDEPDTDHAGVIMTEYDPESRRCRPSHADHAVRAGNRTAHILAHAAGI
ncbi:alpha/beta hydrolase [Streptomyces sp. WAC 00631]|uniref:alpha/beta hydrolase n=1 Tax=unclassified Streptomyces TaxID=2593676 RepID=UPI001E509432|nr:MULTISPECIES: alpha/beta hydrolase [unclassified Streptomyces]MCC5034349.1 alpha/beta hydrolase [Streptomyces sp. WAC 00631]MCC9742276.1 alpha/beta hydrolase [Streptomyces sp. MNU89]